MIRDRMPHAVRQKRKAEIKAFLMADPGYTGAGYRKGYGLSSSAADALLKRWSKLVSIPGLTVHEVASNMVNWTRETDDRRAAKKGRRDPSRSSVLKGTYESVHSGQYARKRADPSRRRRPAKRRAKARSRR